MKKIRLRFAPSPTGYLHIGGLRMALFNYIIAKKYNGDLILRIEDTDSARKVEGAEDSLVNILSWSGINFDEGPHLGGEYSPYVQSERLDIYKKNIEILLEKGLAYPCFCSAEHLQEVRNEQQKNKQAPRYNRACRSLGKEEVAEKIAAGVPYVIRQAMPLSGEVRVVDELRGEIVFKAEDLEDHVLIKSDGVPTYQFASMVDDYLMKISHVVRGEEWIPSYPKNSLLYKAFGWELPKFIHLPLSLNKDGSKLSKRQGDVAVEDYKDKGYLPQALLNFSSLMGWHPKGDEEVMDLDEIIKEFEIKDLRTANAVFDVDKLNYINSQYIKQLSDTEYLKQAKKFSDNTRDELLLLFKDRIKFFAELPELVDAIKELPSYDAGILIWKKSNQEQSKSVLQDLFSLLKDLDWNREKLEEFVFSYIKEKDYGNGDVLWPLRVSLSGQEKSPGPFELAMALGKEEFFRRVETAIKKLA
jgi:glutamyl-tRNA synthetase